MSIKVFTNEQIINKLREAEVMVSHTVPVSFREGKAFEEICRALNINDQTYFS